MVNTDDNSSGAETLLGDERSVEWIVDYNGQAANESSGSAWLPASFIVGMEIAERFAFTGISCNLITYLTGPLGQSTATAAVNVNVLSGTTSLTPLLGAFIADSCLGRYQTIIYFSLIYILGLGLLTLSVTLTPGSRGYNTNNDNSSATPHLHTMMFFTSLYIVAIATGGHKPSTQAFGADQFARQDSMGSNSVGSFFNWYHFGICNGVTASFLISSYIQENLSWRLGIGIQCITMVLALLVFLLGTKTYYYKIKINGRNPFARTAQVFVAAMRNWRYKPSSPDIEEGLNQESRKLSSNRFKFLNKALGAAPDNNQEGSLNTWTVCTVSQVNEAKAILQLVPIWCACLIYAVISAQPSTFFTKQGSTMDRKIGSNFQIPAASLQVFISISIVFVMPAYDRVFVPIARVFTGKPRGITPLQRIGCGMSFSTTSMMLAAIIERKRLKTALHYGLVGRPMATIPMSVWWLVPQYVSYGISYAFTAVGLQEFFYDQVPDGLESLGMALCMSIFGVGSFLSGFLVSIINMVTSANGQDTWVSSNLNNGHLDYFYWFLVGLNIAAMTAFIYLAKSYIYN